MAARRFPIFSFPPNVAERILDYIPIAELFEISLLSKRAFVLVKNSSMLRSKFEIHVDLSASPEVYAFSGHNTINWHFFGKRDSRRQKLEDVETRTVKVSSGEFVFSKLSQNRYALSSDSIQDILQFIQYLSSLFNENVCYLNIDSAQFQNLKTIQSIEALRKSEQVYITEGTVSHEEMVRMIEGFESDVLDISCDPGPNFDYDRPICNRIIGIYAGSWLKGTRLLNLHGEHVHVMNVDVTEEDIAAFLNLQLENRTNMITALFLKETLESDFVFDNRIKKAWDSEKITDALSSFEQELSETEGYNSKRLWRENRTNFIDVATLLDIPSRVTLVKDMSILEANATIFSS